MTDNNELVQHYTLSEPANLRSACERAEIEYLDVDTQRTVVIYRQAILMVIVTEGHATAAREFDIELWKESPNNPSRDPDALVTAFIDELLAATEATRH